jgi:hypothetical protein
VNDSEWVHLDWALRAWPCTLTFIVTVKRSYVEELDGPAVSVLRRAMAEIKQRWSLDG